MVFWTEPKIHVVAPQQTLESVHALLDYSRTLTRFVLLRPEQCLPKNLYLDSHHRKGSSGVKQSEASDKQATGRSGLENAPRKNKLSLQCPGCHAEIYSLFALKT